MFKLNKQKGFTNNHGKGHIMVKKNISNKATATTNVKVADTNKILLNGGRPLNMTSIYHGEFASGNPYTIPPSNWTSQIQFTDYIYYPTEKRMTRNGQSAGTLVSAGSNDLTVIFVHTYNYPGKNNPRLIWYSHIVPQYNVYRCGFLVLDINDLFLDAMEWDFLGQAPRPQLSNFEEVEYFINNTVKVVPYARLLFAAKPSRAGEGW